jgi:tetratricopeptide (TPR) repeat protein
MSGLYSDNDVYTSQLRALEQYVEQNPDAPEGHFVLAYHYLTAGHSDVALDEFKDVLKLNPQDELAAQLVRSLGGPEVEEPKPSEPVAPAKPVEGSSIVGKWKSSRPDGSSFGLNLTKDNTYKWEFTKGGKTQAFEGSYSLSDNVLILKQDEQAMMVGQLTMSAANKMNFKLAGNNPADPGLTFTK